MKHCPVFLFAWAVASLIYQWPATAKCFLFGSKQKALKQWPVRWIQILYSQTAPFAHTGRKEQHFSPSFDWYPFFSFFFCIFWAFFGLYFPPLSGQCCYRLNFNSKFVLDSWESFDSLPPSLNLSVSFSVVEKLIIESFQGEWVGECEVFRCHRVGSFIDSCGFFVATRKLRWDWQENVPNRYSPFDLPVATC